MMKQFIVREFIMSCKPVLNGVLWNLGRSLFPTEEMNYDFTRDQWRADFDAMKHLGIDKFMIFTGVPQGMNRPANDGSDMIDLIAGECDRCNMDLIIATGGHPGWWRDLEVGKEMVLVKGFVEELLKRYGHHKSFAGWYIDYEISMRFGDLHTKLRDLYKEIVLLCKEKTPDLPVIASPFFHPATETDIMRYGNHPPQEFYEYWSDMIAYSKVDAISLQDNGGQHLSFFDTSLTEPYIAAFAKACSENNCQFWGNVETGEFHIGSAREFTDKFGENGDVNYVENPFDHWRSVPMGRLQKKLEVMSKYSVLNLSWGYQAFYRPCMGDKAAVAYKDYEKYLQKNFPEMLK